MFMKKKIYTGNKERIAKTYYITRANLKKLNRLSKKEKRSVCFLSGQIISDYLSSL